MKSHLFILITLFVLSSCKTRTLPKTPINTQSPLESTTAFFKTIKKEADFEQVKINSKITANVGTFIPQMDATIYIENNQKIWINMVAIFLNVGRGVATPEGIKAYEKWNKTYIESDFGYLNSLLNVDFIDYHAFQNLLLGKAFIPINEKSFSVTSNAQGFALNSIKNLRFKTKNSEVEYKAILQYSPTFDLDHVSLQKVGSNDELILSYSNWENYDAMRLPKNVKIIIKGTKESQILLENTKFENSRMATPYTVPSNYTKTEIK